METRSDEAPLQRGSLPKRTPQQDFYFETNTGYIDHVGLQRVWSIDNTFLTFVVLLRDGMVPWWIASDRLSVVLAL